MTALTACPYRVTAKDFYGEDEEWDDEEGYDDDDEEFTMEDIIGYLIRFDNGTFEVTSDLPT